MKDRRGTIRRRARVVPVEAPRVEGARAVVLVEGVSDKIAVEVAAARLGREIAGVAVLAAGGVGNIGALAARFAKLPLAGLCDAAEVGWVCKAMVNAQVGIALNREELARLGFYVCDRDLEDELIRALGPDEAEALLAREGDLTAFRTLQRQKVWADAPFADQLRRFLGAGAGRKLLYAKVFTENVALARMPTPLVAVLDRVAGVAG